MASTIREKDIKKLREAGYLAKKINHRLPTAGQIDSTPEPQERVVFLPHFVRGLGFPLHPFVRDIMYYYGIDLHDLSPNSFLNISTFIVVCEAFLRISPHFSLWLKIFNVKPKVVGGEHAECGGAMVSKMPKIRWSAGTFNDSVKEWQQHVVLHTIDELWKDHLRQLDDLRQSVRNASYEQKDPLVIYKVESFHLFEQMLNELNVKAISTLMRGQIYTPQQPGASQGVPPQQPQQRAPEQPAQSPASDAPAAEAQPAPAPEPAPAPKPAPKVERAMPEAPSAANPNMRASKEAYPGEAAMRAAASAPQGEAPKPQPVKAAPRVGRNDPCPCGSGKKYKNCHGRGL